MEVLWKVMEGIIDARIKKAVTFHDVLHKFCAGKGTGTAIMELKLTQEMTSLDQDLILLVFLDLIKNLTTWTMARY